MNIDSNFFQQMLNNYVKFGFSNIKKILDLTNEYLVNILGEHEIGINIHGCQPNPRNGHLCTKIGSLPIAIVRHCT